MVDRLTRVSTQMLEDVGNLGDYRWLEVRTSFVDLLLATVTGGSPAVVERFGAFVWDLQPRFEVRAFEVRG